MSNIYPSILEKFTTLNIDIFRHEDAERSKHGKKSVKYCSKQKAKEEQKD